MPVVHIFDVGILGPVEFVGRYSHPLLDEHPLGDACRVGVTEQFANLLLYRLNFILAGTSLHFTRTGRYLWGQWVSGVGCSSGSWHAGAKAVWSVARCDWPPEELRLVGSVITRLGEWAELDFRPTGHSTRRGGATSAKRAKNDRKSIAAQGGWVDNSMAMEGYFEEVNG